MKCKNTRSRGKTLRVAPLVSTHFAKTLVCKRKYDIILLQEAAGYIQQQWPPWATVQY